MATAETPENIEVLTARIYKEYINGLTENLKLLHSGSTKCPINYLYRFLKEKKILPLPPAPGCKDTEKSIRYRSEGNQHYSKYWNYSALKSYNRAIACAPNSSEELALAYGNRSAASYELGHPESCVRDIERAIANGYDESKQHKLIKRRESCSTLKPAVKNDPAVAKFQNGIIKSLSSTKPDIPCASDKLSLLYDTNSGRKIVANQDIKPGEILAIEEPYITILRPNFYNEHCYHCCKKSYDLIPCDSCSYIMFCSNECQTDAWKQYHRHECPIMYYLTGMGFEKMVLLALRVVMKARTEYDTWTEFRETVQRLDAETDALTRGFVDNIYTSKSYPAIHVLENNMHRRTESDLYEKFIIGTVLISLLKEYSNFFDGAGDADMWQVGLMIAHHTMTAASNMHSIEGLAETEKHEFKESYEYGSGAYAFMSLVNHSCNPNVCRHNFGTTAIMYCLRPIKQGDEVFDNYGLHYAMNSTYERRKQLLHQYKFICRCVACDDEWPQYNALQPLKPKSKKAPNLKRRLTAEMFEKLLKGDRNTALDILDDMYERVALLEDYAPCRELADTQETLKQCWGIFGDVFYYEK